MRHSIALFAVAALIAVDAAAEDASIAGDSQVVRGSVHFKPADREKEIAEAFRLAPHDFSFEQRNFGEVSPRFDMSLVTFPSPVETPHEVNNTVHCEYYRPKGEGKRPAVIVLHILGGDFLLSRAVCGTLVERGVGALFVKLPYYGPRRDPASKRRMISPDPGETVEGMTQAVLDIRRATAWLGSREEVDPRRLGICGISLGGITSGLAATAEPRLQNICMVLAGGDVGRIAWESPKMEKIRQSWIENGGTREEFLATLSKVDPVTYAANVRGRRMLMLNADRDEVIPRACTESLWRSFGEPEIVWYEGGHYSIARHMLPMLDRASRFFAESDAEAP
ncbi:MAG: alpha/beta hydrolase family protein [Pirellulaceae bacterium]